MAVPSPLGMGSPFPCLFLQEPQHPCSHPQMNPSTMLWRTPPPSTYIQVVPHGFIMYPRVRVSRLKKLVGQVVRMLLQVIFQPVFLPEVFSDGLDPCQGDSLSQHWERETDERQ